MGGTARLPPPGHHGKVGCVEHIAAACPGGRSAACQHYVRMKLATGGDGPSTTLVGQIPREEGLDILVRFDPSWARFDQTWTGLAKLTLRFDRHSAPWVGPDATDILAGLAICSGGSTKFALNSAPSRGSQCDWRTSPNPADSLAESVPKFVKPSPSLVLFQFDVGRIFVAGLRRVPSFSSAVGCTTRRRARQAEQRLRARAGRSAEQTTLNLVRGRRP